MRPASLGAAVLLAASPLMADTNPFLEKSPLQYQAPQFDRIKVTDCAPALEERMKRGGIRSWSRC